MSFRQWLAKKIIGRAYNPNQSVITDEMRERALAVRRQEHALKQKEKEIAVMERILSIETKVNPKETPMDKLISEVLPLLVMKLKTEHDVKQTELNTTTIDVENKNPIKKDFSEKEIKEIISANPKLKQFASQFSDDDIKGYLQKQIPNVTDDSLNKFIAEVRA